LENWAEIFPVLRKGMWAAKIDLKHAYFHLGIAEELKPYICIQVQEKVFQFQAACFGMSTLPQAWQSVMKVFLKKWRKAGILSWIYLDDILVVGNSPKAVQKHLDIMLQDLELSGMVVNKKKSQLVPSQQVEHLGFSVDFKSGHLQVPKEKMRTIRKELGKLLTHSEMTTRKMAAILGSTRSFLMAMPFLRAFTDQLVQFVCQQEKQGWDRKLPIPQALKDQVKEMGLLMEKWKGRTFQGKIPVRELHSDSSQEAWAGVDVTSGQITQMVQEFWRDKKGLHINVKELEAAINTVKSLAKPGEHVLLKVDNSVTFSYLTKGGGRIPSLNQQVRPFIKWCLKNGVTFQVQQVKSAEDLADGPSRWQQDRGDYTMDRNLFKCLLKKLRHHVQPKVDFFASPGNHQLKKFVSRFPHWEAVEVDALKCPLSNFCHCYANPPWKIISKWLHRLRENPHMVCMMITPFWVSSPWWPLLLKLHVRGTPAFLIDPYPGMFSNCWGESMPAPRWPLVCTVLSGKAYRPNKSALRLQKITSWA
jgi:transcriptional regulator of met regulon